MYTETEVQTEFIDPVTIGLITTGAIYAGKAIGKAGMATLKDEKVQECITHVFGGKPAELDELEEEDEKVNDLSDDETTQHHANSDKILQNLGDYLEDIANEELV